MKFSLFSPLALGCSLSLATASGAVLPSPTAPSREQHQMLSVSSPAENDSVEAEWKSFQVAEGYTIQLFASEADGIANPIVTRFDARGRLWVLCSDVYPQVVPDDLANDKLYILEDTDRDGRADKTTVFAQGLNMPMGFALGDGGVYVGNGRDLLFFRDTDGDDQADTREVLFTGFGTDDTHQNLNSFTWSPGGELFACQGLHAYSAVETPWGIVRLNEHGVMRLRPRRRQWHAFPGGSGQNPWGIHFMQWGQPIIKGNSPVISELLPTMVHTDVRHKPLDIGQTQIKSMIVHQVDSPSLPADLQGDVLIAGYFARMIDRLSIEPDGSGHRMENKPPLLITSHPSFRPVDIQTGPDGALYIADWYNPIIGHYQASFRHPDRDKHHGRIWRITAKEVPVVRSPSLAGLEPAKLVQHLDSPVRWEREQARQELSAHPSENVRKAVLEWLDHPTPQSQPAAYREHLALSVLEWHEQVDEQLLRKQLNSPEPLARAYATRVLGRWSDRLPSPLPLLEKSVMDSHPRVRLEAVVASAEWTSPEAITIAARALEQPMDRFLEAALTQASIALKPRWFPALAAGKLAFHHSDQLASVLQRAAGKEAANLLRSLIENSDTPEETRSTLLVLLAGLGQSKDLELAWNLGSRNPEVLRALASSAKVRGIRPSALSPERLKASVTSGSPEQRAAAWELAQTLRVTSLREEAASQAQDPGLPATLRSSAILALGAMADSDAQGLLSQLANSAEDLSLATSAIQALLPWNPEAAARAATRGILRSREEATTAQWVLPFLLQKDADMALAAALESARAPKQRALEVLRVVSAAGRRSLPLEKALGHGDSSKGAIGVPEYSEDLVAQLSSLSRRSGNPEAGRKIYASAELNCAACHRIGDQGGEFGPELTAVGSGLPVELLVEAVLWPHRQVKEGYLATSLTTKDGASVVGYVQSERDGLIVIRDITSRVDTTLPLKQVADRQDAGTIMPAGLTSQLSRTQVADLIAYLASLKGSSLPGKR